MEFTWRMTDILAWPIIILLLLLLYRSRIMDLVSRAIRGVQLKRIKAGPVEVEWEATLDAAGRSVAGALAETATLPGEGDPIPTSLVDFIPLIAANPRRAANAMFQQVRRALEHTYPELAGTTAGDLPTALRELTRGNVLDPEIEVSVTKLQQLLPAQDDASVPFESARAYQFLSLAEGTIHAILRGARRGVRRDTSRPAVADGLLKPVWRGRYNKDYRIELRIMRWDAEKFEAEMLYPESGTTTLVTGQVDDGDQTLRVEWQETGYQNRGRRTISFNGRYRATVSGRVMDGAWYDSNDRLVAKFQLTAE